MTELGRLLFRNTVTNYIRLFFNILGAIFITRIIFLGMGEQLYGFWSLLWTIFGYSLLLDFGFGRTVQKYTAEKDFDRSHQAYNRIISIVFGTYLAEALLIAAVSVVLSFFLADLFKFAPGADLSYYRLCFLVFGLGVAVVFPSGIVIEILTGMNRIDLRNFALIGHKITELTGIYIIFHCGGSLLALAIYTNILNLLVNLVVLVMILRLQPQLRLTWAGFNLKTLRKIADFSIFSYVLTIADMINQKTDRLVLGVMVGVSGVSSYQLGTRVPEMVTFMSTQFQESLSPLAASMYKAGDYERLRRIMVASTRLTVFISTGAFVIFGALAPQILYLWLKVNSVEVVQIAYAMLLSGYIMVAIRSVPSRCLLMAGRHRFVSVTTIIECLVNLGLSIVLVHYYGTIGVAIGTLIPNAIMALLVILPVFAGFSGYSLWRYLFRIYLPALAVAIPPLLFFRWVSLPLSLTDWTLFRLGWTAVVGGLIYLVIGWVVLVRREEKNLIVNRIPGLPEWLRHKLTGGTA